MNQAGRSSLPRFEEPPHRNLHDAGVSPAAWLIGLAEDGSLEVAGCAGNGEARYRGTEEGAAV